MIKQFLLLSFCSVLLIAACKKEKSFHSDGTATIQVVNADVGITGIKLNMYNLPVKWWSTTSQVNYGASAFYYAQRIATPITVVSSADTANPLLNSTYNIRGNIYTLYIAGQFPTIDTIMREETNYPYVQLDRIPSDADSIINIRFVNLSPNSSPVNINILGSAVNEVSNLAYKGITNFKAYTAKIANPNYKFEIRDAATNTILLTYTFNVTATNRFKNVALVLKGLQGASGTNAFGVFAVNYFQ